MSKGVFLVFCFLGLSLIGFWSRSSQSPSLDQPIALGQSALPSPVSTLDPRIVADIANHPSPSLTAAPPDSVMAVLANFYAAYQQADRERLASFFTPDTDADDQTLAQHLFKIDNQPPILFVTPEASERATSYTLLASASEGQNWLLTLEEVRQSKEGSNQSEITLLTLVPAPIGQATWLIASYSHVGNSGKYDGFLLQ